MTTRDKPLWAVAVLGLLVFVWIYVPVMGLGFVRDDAAWITQSRVGTMADLSGLLGQHNGFYQPAVALSFSLDWWLCGTNAKGYALTNSIFEILAASATYGFFRAFGLSQGPGLFGCLLWLLNPHGLLMALMS